MCHAYGAFFLLDEKNYIFYYVFKSVLKYVILFWVQKRGDEETKRLRDEVTERQGDCVFILPATRRKPPIQLFNFVKF